MHSLHTARSIAAIAARRAFGASARVLNTHSDLGSTTSSTYNTFIDPITPRSAPIHHDATQLPGTSKRRKKEKQSKKKKIHPKVKSAVPTTRSPVESAAAFNAKRPGVFQALAEGSHEKNHCSEDPWTTGWGNDALRPREDTNSGLQEALAGHGRQTTNRFTRRAPPPHIRHPLPYTRRVEGLFDDVRDLNPPSSTNLSSVKNVLQDVDPQAEHKPIARLTHGLDRVLFNPGVHWLQDPRSRVYNFTPWLENIPKVTDFAFERVTGFIRSSQDNDLHDLAKIHSRPYVGSTSSLTGLLSHIYFLVSGGKDVDTSLLSGAFAHQPANFTPGQRMPVSVVLRYKDGVWAVDSGKDGDDDSDKNVLTWMGTLLEKFLTIPEPAFKTLLRSSPVPAEGEQDDRREAYRYAKSDRFMMRSQLDCVDPRLPGTGVFDVKTRAAVPIRQDLLNFEEHSGYLIRRLHGPLESFEKEYYDLIRSAFLKYSFQARIGNMDGVFVAYHNTARIFGFQYISLEEMDARLFGPDERNVGAPNGGSVPTRGGRIFEKCVKLLERVTDEIVGLFGERSVKCTIETRERSSKMNIWVEPVEWDAKKEGEAKNLIEGEENRGKTEEPPIVQIDVEVQNFIAGEHVKGPRAIGVQPDENWILHWSISHSSLDASKIRANLASAKERQFRAWNFPANISGPEEMEAWWNALDFGGRKIAASSLSHSEGAVGSEVAISGLNDVVAGDETRVETVGEDALTLAEEEESAIADGTRHQNSVQVFNPKLFRSASTNIELLRQLSRDGREETLRAEAEEEAMGRDKIVWGLACSEIVKSGEPSTHCSATSALARTVEVVENEREAKDEEIQPHGH